MLECSDRSFYTGITNDVKKRIETHNTGKGAKYTRSRLPVKLIYQEKHSSKSSAMKREIEIKKYSRLKKENLITKEVL
jgi:putative endonuclease